MHEVQRIVQGIQQSQQSGTRAVLATVVQTQGSVYRRPGARMLVTAEGHTIGAISGGCLERDILERSHPLLSGHGEPILVRYDTTSREDIVFGFGLGCNGIVDVLIEPLGAGTVLSQFSLMQACWATQQIGAIATIWSVEGGLNVRVGDRLLMKPDRTVIHQIANLEVAQLLAADTGNSLRNQQTCTRSYTLAAGRLTVLIEVIRPPVPLLVFGAGYDAIPVVQLAKQLGWQVTVLDHRADYLTRDRFPQADCLHCCQPDDPATYADQLTPQTMAVVMTHRYLTDLAFLKTLVPSPVRYLGVLGPQRRMQQLWQDLQSQGVPLGSQPDLRIYNPVGLDIGAETAEEIALSIVAEMQAVLGGRSGRCLRDRVGTIHSSQPPCLELAS